MGKTVYPSCPYLKYNTYGGDILSENILEMRGIIKQFPATRALDDVNFAVKKGSIHALVGENGAGKSTLMKVLSGLWPYGSYEGDVIYNGEICKFSGIKDSEEKGIVIIHQELAMVPYMSIGENMFLGNEKGKKFNIDWDTTYAEADKYLKIVGLHESSKTLIKDIGVGKQQLVEIAKALAKHAKLLILDEPTSSLNEEDSKALLDLLLRFKKEGLTSIIISHKLNEVSYVADSITIVRDGKTIETLTKGVDDISEDRIIRGMVGREIADRFPKRHGVEIGDVALEIENWNVYHPIYTEKKVVDNVSLNVKKGEVVGISGLMGAGRTELAMSVFGHSYGSNISGTVKINGQEVHLHSPRDAINHGLAYVTEDRKGNGLILSNPIRVNTTLANLKGVCDLADKYGALVMVDESHAVGVLGETVFDERNVAANERNHLLDVTDIEQTVTQGQVQEFLCPACNAAVCIIRWLESVQIQFILKCSVAFLAEFFGFGFRWFERESVNTAFEWKGMDSAEACTDYIDGAFEIILDEIF